MNVRYNQTKDDVSMKPVQKPEKVSNIDLR